MASKQSLWQSSLISRRASRHSRSAAQALCRCQTIRRRLWHFSDQVVFSIRGLKLGNKLRLDRSRLTASSACPNSFPPDRCGRRSPVRLSDNGASCVRWLGVRIGIGSPLAHAPPSRPHRENALEDCVVWVCRFVFDVAMFVLRGKCLNIFVRSYSRSETSKLNAAA
jgi:hypothetical protein